MESIDQVRVDAPRAAATPEHNREHDPNTILDNNGHIDHDVESPPPGHVNHNSTAFADNHGLDALQAATAVQGLGANGGHSHGQGGRSAAGEHREGAAIGTAGHHNTHPSGDAMSASAVAAAAVAVAQQLEQYAEGHEHLPGQPEQEESNSDPDGSIPVDMNLTYQVDPALGVDVDHAHFDHESASPPPVAVHHQPPQVHHGPEHYRHSPPPAQPPLHSNGLRTIHPQQPPYNVSTMVAPSSAIPRDSANNPKKTRLSRACDGCSLRKVKCDASGPPCKPCAELKVPCTNVREKKRRGPPNRHLEKLRQGVKRPRLDEEEQSQDFSTPPVADPQQASPAPSVADAPSNVEPNLQVLGPYPFVLTLINDFFSFVHPLLPFPSEYSFRAALADPAERARADFLRLVASMLAALAALFPRTVRQHLKVQAQANHDPATVLAWPRAQAFASKCIDIALSSRGNRWILHPSKSLNDAITSYFLAVASEALGNARAMRMLMAESVTLLREADLSRRNSPESPVALHSNDQLSRRLFWALVRQKRSLSQAGLPHDFGIPQSTAQHGYYAMPEDESVDSLVFDGMATDEMPQLGPMTGFLASLDVYNTMSPLDDAPPFLSLVEKRDLLRQGLMEAKNIIRRLPAELQISSSFTDSAFTSANLDSFRLTLENPQKRRSVQLEILKANLHVSLLATRSYFVTQHSRLRDEGLAAMTIGGQAADDGEALQQMRDECDFLAHNVVAVMSTLSRHSLEPNFHAIFTRLSRVVNCALETAPAQYQSEGGGLRHPADLRWLMDWLARTDKALAPSSDDGGWVTEEDEAQAELLWAELRDWQRGVAGDAIGDGDDLPMELQTIKFEQADGASEDLSMDAPAHALMHPS